jgi:hypothetical protein
MSLIHRHTKLSVNVSQTVILLLVLVCTGVLSLTSSVIQTTAVAYKQWLVFRFGDVTERKVSWNIFIDLTL